MIGLLLAWVIWMSGLAVWLLSGDFESTVLIFMSAIYIAVQARQGTRLIIHQTQIVHSGRATRDEGRAE